jgi:hypothetical protein
MVRLAATVEPRAENRAAYDACYARYLDTYPALRGLMHQLADGK